MDIDEVMENIGYFLYTNLDDNDRVKVSINIDKKGDSIDKTNKYNFTFSDMVTLK